MDEYAHAAPIVSTVLLIFFGLLCAYWANTNPSWGPWLYVAAGWCFRSSIVRARKMA